MANSNFDGTMLPSYGDDSPVEPVEKGNIDLAANNYASALQKAALEGMMVFKDGSFYTLIPKVGPDGIAIDNSKAVRLYKKTNGHFGRFYNDREAKMYSSWLRNKVAEVAKYFPNEAIVEITPDSAFTKGFLTKVALNKSILRHNIKQVLSYSKKSLGRPLRRASEPFDANAIDGDEDGIVQDGTMWARPAMPGKPIVASMRSGKNGNLFVPEDTKRAASKLLATLKKEEPAITKNIEEIARLSRGRAKLVDLDSRFKDVQSLGQKIERLKGNWNNNVAAAASEMNDGLRYTFVVPNNDDYSKFVSSTLSLLQGQGMKITAWNYWNSKDPYNGVNAMVQHPNGFNYEIQFHTPKSYADKKKLEPLYTKFRDEKSESKRKEIFERMQTISKDSSTPEGIESVGRSVSRGYKFGTFTPETVVSSVRSKRIDSGDQPEAGRSFFPYTPRDIPLSRREKQRLDALMQEWLGALMHVIGNDDARYPMHKGPKLTTSKGIVGVWKVGKTGQQIDAEEMKQEVYQYIMDQVAWLAAKDDYSFLSWLPVTRERSDEGLKWWNGLLEKSGLVAKDGIGTRALAGYRGKKDENGNPIVSPSGEAIRERTTRNVPETMEELVKRARNNVGARKNKRYEKEFSSSGGRRSDDDEIDEIGITEVDYDQAFDDEAAEDVGDIVRFGGQTSGDIEQTLGDTTERKEPYISGSEVIEVERDGKIVETTVPVINKSRLLAALDERMGAEEGEPGPATRLSEAAPVLFNLMVDKYVREMTREQLERVNRKNALPKKVFDALYYDRGADRGRSEDILLNDEQLGSILGGRFATEPIENWHEIVNDLARQFSGGDDSWLKVAKANGLSELSGYILKSDVVEARKRIVAAGGNLDDQAEAPRVAGRVAGRVKKGAASAIDKRDIAIMIRNLSLDGTPSKIAIWNAIYEYMGRPANVNNSNAGNAKSTIANFLGMSRPELDAFIESILGGTGGIKSSPEILHDSYFVKNGMVLKNNRTVLSKRLY